MIRTGLREARRDSHLLLRGADRALGRDAVHLPDGAGSHRGRKRTPVRSEALRRDRPVSLKGYAWKWCRSWRTVATTPSSAAETRATTSRDGRGKREPSKRQPASWRLDQLHEKLTRVVVAEHVQGRRGRRSRRAAVGGRGGAHCLGCLPFPARSIIFERHTHDPHLVGHPSLGRFRGGSTPKAKGTVCPQEQKRRSLGSLVAMLLTPTVSRPGWPLPHQAVLMIGTDDRCEIRSLRFSLACKRRRVFG
eukprot:scaffold526_cov230-Pinguiococcus_pyrenoidosus.AAC.4